MTISRIVNFSTSAIIVALLALASVCQAAETAAAAAKPPATDGDAAHMKILARDRYPSATQCANCHPRQYRQWSMSQHAYSQMSPVFNAMQATIFKITNGSNGDFCVRCHTPIGMNLGESEFMSNIDRHAASREGVSCVVCHRVSQAYGKISGRFPLSEGPITSPVYGPTGPQKGLDEVINKAGLVTDPKTPGRQIHAKADKLFQMTQPDFCGTCHDVTLVNGFRLEEAYSEYKHTPAAKRGVTCQDCHMGKEPGKTVVARSDPDFERKNYDYGPAAKVGSVETAPRKLTNHMFVGPDYSVLPPSLFPMNARAIKEESQKNDPAAPGMATIREWLLFDDKAGWGTDKFEDGVSDDAKFPDRWASVDDRYDARALITENEKLINEMSKARLQLLRNGFVLGDVQTLRSGPDGIEFRVEIRNGTDGHDVPTGFDAERVIWLYVRVLDADGRIVYAVGRPRPERRRARPHSLYVHNGELPLDRQLFNLQSKFLTTNVRGGEREQVLALNYSVSPLPYIRPSTSSTVLIGRPTGARKHRLTIDPLGHRWADYKVDSGQLSGRPPYHAVIELKAAMVPVNLLNEIRGVGFDYNMSARNVADNLVAGHIVVWKRDVPLSTAAPVAMSEH